MNAILQNNLSAVKEILQKHKVVRAYAFGSVCTDKFNDESDIDFLITFQKGLDPVEHGEHWFQALYDLRNLLHRDVDLITETSLQNPYFIKALEKTKTLLYE